MRRVLLTLFTVLMTVGSVSAQSGKLSPYTRIYLAKHKTEIQQRAKSAAGTNIVKEDSIDAFLQLKSGEDESEIEANGVNVVNRFGQILTVRMPISGIEKVGNLKSVQYLSLGEPVTLNNDSARICSNVNILHQGGGSLGQQYKGKGVIVGIVDTGIEYNHINFKDANGKSRVKMVYDAVNKKTYTDPDDIAALTTDNDEEVHGTHTSGTAAGSYDIHGYQGMAPEADLILCGQGPKMYNTGIINSIQKIFAYANLIGKPAVVNLSLGSITGPHDGTDQFNQTINSFKAPGNIICFSSANSAGKDVYIKNKSANGDGYKLQFKTLISVRGVATNTEIGLWNKSSDAFYVKMAVVNKTTGEILAEKLYAPDVMTETTKDTTYEDSVSFKKYAEGTVIVSGELNKFNNRYNQTVDISVMFKDAYPDCRMAMMVYAKKDQVIEAWNGGSGSRFMTYSLSGYICGNDSCCANDQLYNNNSIGVGAYCTRNYFINPQTKEVPQGWVFERGDVVSFSSYGKRDDGTVIPDIIAPGSVLISSFNGYARYKTDEYMYMADSVNEGGKTYYWGGISGTSMSCPVVTGIIATWLQYKPTLTVEEIKDIFDNTAISDYYVKKYNYVKSGRGKIDAFGGLKYLLATNIGNTACAQHQVLIYPSADGKVNIYAQGETGDIHVGVYASNGMTVFNRTLATTDGSATLNLGDNLPKGVYIVKVEGVQAKGSNTLTIR